MLLYDLFKDTKTHKWSLSKVILGIGFVFASAVLLKMALLHEPEISTAFVAYLAFISGHDNLRRIIDKKKDQNGP